LRTIIGYGNDLRGEDAFGRDVLKNLALKKPQNTQLLSLFQLTPEIVLNLLESDEIVFVDACYSDANHYKLACSLEEQKIDTLSHHISYTMIVNMLNNLYDIYPKYEVFSMLSSQFDEVKDKIKYRQVVESVSTYLSVVEQY